MKSGKYDVISASGDAASRPAAGNAAPVNTDLLKNYAEIAPFLKDQAINSIDAKRAATARLGCQPADVDTHVVKPTPTSWSAVFDGASGYVGKVTVYDSPIYIVDAAPYLMNTSPTSGSGGPARSTPSSSPRLAF